MPKARKELISLDATPYYHCTSRCVRRAFLCGLDHFTGKSYEHRRAWVEDRILFLAGIFAVDVCAYAVMSNHHHVVLRVDSNKANNFTDQEVCDRWHKLYKGTLLTQRFALCEALSEAELAAVRVKVQQWRLQLCNISWFMKALNEPIARMANAEDQCSGRFFESRFKSQALLDEQALAACMAYVDLNPIRAKMAETPEQSEHTSVKKRVEALSQSGNQPAELLAFTGNPANEVPSGLPFCLTDYLELVDWTGRQIREDKRGAINANLPPILDRLCIETAHWLDMTQQFESRFKSLVGCGHRLKMAAKLLGFTRTPGMAACQSAFP